MICSLIGLCLIEEIKNKDLAFKYFDNLICKYNITTFLFADIEDFCYELCFIFKDLKAKYPNLQFFNISICEFFCKPKLEKFDYSLLVNLSDICLIHLIDKKDLNIPLKYLEIFSLIEKAYEKFKDNKKIIIIPKTII